MMWLRVQRSGLTCIRATTRSLSASTKVTPLSSAKGIFIDWIFSSGVMIAGPLPFLACLQAWIARVSQAMTSEVMEMLRGGRLGLLHSAPFGDEERGGLGRFPKRIEIDVFVEAVHRRATGTEAETRDVVVQPVEPGIGKRREHEIFNLRAVHRGKGLAEGGLGFGGILELIAFRQEARPLHFGRIVGKKTVVARSSRHAGQDLILAIGHRPAGQDRDPTIDVAQAGTLEAQSPPLMMPGLKLMGWVSDLK